MNYALVQNGTLMSWGSVPRSARRLDTQEWVLGLREADDATRASCGYLPIVNTPRPTLADGEEADSSYELVDGVPTQVWTVRAKSESEIQIETVAANEIDLKTKLRDFVGTIVAILDSRAADITAVNSAISAQITERDTALADVTTFTAARDAAQVVIDDAVSTAAQKNAARTDKAIALANLSAARHNVQAARLALDVLRLAKDQINDSAKVARATVALLRLVIGSDLLESTEGT
jgi:hypothetical protein